MRKTTNVALLTMLLMAAVGVQAQDLTKYPWLDTQKSFHDRAVLLVSSLTLAEKIAQMGNMVDADVRRNGVTIVPAYQYWNEALHGVARSGAATSFPESKGLSATWDRQLVYDCATAISDEARVYNNLYKKGLNYWCPTINMSRDPRWGRDEENYGEDPFLAGTLAVQFVRGMQGEQTAANPYLKTVALVGPYANAIMLGDYSGTPTHTTTPFEAFSKKLDFHVSDGTIQAENFSAVVNGSAAKMNQGSGYLENTAPGNEVLYRNVDFGSGCTHFVMVAATKSTGVATVNFYLDSDSGKPFLSVSNEDTGNWTKWKEITATVDPDVVKGVHNLYVKFTGTQKYAGNYDYFRFYNPDANPLETTGPLYMVQTSNAVNEAATDEMIARAVAVAQKADVVIFCGGTDYSKPADHATGTESHDRWLLTMPGNQTDVLKALYAVNKNVVLVLDTNSSMDITWEKEHLPAIIEAWYGGQAQGQAICDVIYGDYNPSGKLTSTWYNRLWELPSASDSQFGANGMLEYNIDEWGYTYMYYGKGTGANVKRQADRPMYPFGFGLSYTTFSYSDLQISSAHVGKGQTVSVTATVENTGTRDGAEVVQLYVSFPGSAVTHRPLRKLVGFERVELKAGERKTVTIPLSHDQLAYYNESTHTFDVEAGTVNVYVSASSADDRLTGTLNAEGAVVKTTYLTKDDSAAIVTPTVGTSGNTAAVYDLQGRRMTAMTLKPGLYIMGHQKVYVK
jgi:beta-glucosidase